MSWRADLQCESMCLWGSSFFTVLCRTLFRDLELVEIKEPVHSSVSLVSHSIFLEWGFKSVFSVKQWEGPERLLLQPLAIVRLSYEVLFYIILINVFCLFLFSSGAQK